MMRKFMLSVFVLFLCMTSLTTFAAEGGSIEVQLPTDMRGEKIYIMKEGEEAQTLLVDEHGIAKVEQLSTGTYQIDVGETDDYKFTQAKVSIPMWSEEEQKMLYEVSVIPKYTVKEKPKISEEIVSPQTGDVYKGTTYMSFGVISLIILVIMSCHNHFNCDTMTVKYSQNGGRSNGNDNDTENPCGARRIRISSSGTID